MRIGIIGFGRLGELIGTRLGMDFPLLIFDPYCSAKKKEAFLKTYRHLGHEWVDEGGLSSFGELQWIILCVPINQIKNAAQNLAPYFNSSGRTPIVVDTCSVKEHPLQMMKEFLPPGTAILGTHPMFGPDSAKEGFVGLKIVLCNHNLKDRELALVRTYLYSHGLNVIEKSPEEHDQEISSSLFLAHFLGRTLIELNAKELEIDTKGYRRLLRILDTVKNDGLDLFLDMYTYNRFSKNVKKNLQDALAKVSLTLENAEHQKEKG